MAYQVVIPKDITEPGKGFLRERGYEVIVGDGSRDPERLREMIKNADGILARTGDYSGYVLSAAPHLKVVGRHGVGMDGFDLNYCRKNGIRVVNAPGANAESVAEHTVGQLVALAHRFLTFDRAVQTGDWGVLTRLPTWDLTGKTLGIVGVGSIGSLVATKASAAFSMRIIGYSPRKPRFAIPQDMELVPDIETLFRQSDFVSLHLPLNESTRGIVGETLIAMMKKDSYLINNARGGVLDEAALAKAVREGRIAGAAIDVFTTEPLPLTSPLLGAENILLTPHSSALTRESMDRMGLLAAMGIDEVLSGREPSHPVV